MKSGECCVKLETGCFGQCWDILNSNILKSVAEVKRNSYLYDLIFFYLDYLQRKHES